MKYNFENNLKHYVDRAEQTPYMIAILSGLPYATVYNYYHCKKPMWKAQYDTLYRLARTLKTTPRNLIKIRKEKE